MVLVVLASAFLLWGAVERRRHYSDTPRTFALACVWAAGRLASASLNVLTGGGIHEPFSARTGRSAWLCKRWEKVEKFVDAVFFAAPHHCRDSWLLADARAGYKLRYCLEWIWHDR